MRPFRTAAVALLWALLVAPAAHAKFPSSIETTVAPGRGNPCSSPTLPPTMKSATVDVAPARPADEAFFDDMQVVLSLQPSPGKRLMMCVGLYINVAHGIDEGVELQFPEEVHPLAVLMLSACLEVAAQVDRAQQTQPAATSAAAKCPERDADRRDVHARRSKYRATIEGTRPSCTSAAG